MAEIYDIRIVKDEFLHAVYEQYLQIYNERQFEASVILLTEFCNNIYNNDLALVRIDKEQIAPQPNIVREVPRPTDMPDPFAADMHDKLHQDIAELNKNIAPSNKQPTDDVDLGTEHKRSFIDKVRDMRSVRKNPNRINPEN